MLKRVCLIVSSALFVALITVQASAAGFALRTTVDFGGDLEGKVSGLGSLTFDAKTGISIALEVDLAGQEEYDSGFGIEYQLDRALDNPTDPEFSFIPVYWYGKYYVDYSESSPFILARFGYNVVHSGNNAYEGAFGAGAELSGGLFFAIGAGMSLGGGSQLELTYSVNYGEGELGGLVADIKYSRVNVGFVYKF